jgi:hypothetical protein
MSNIQTSNGSNGQMAGQQPLFRPPFTIKDRTLVRKGSTIGEPNTFKLEEVRDYLKKLERLQDPVDHDRSLDQLHIDFEGKHMKGRFLARDGISKEIMLVSQNGAAQLASEVLPSRFFSGLQELALMDESGEKLSTMVWDKFSGQYDRLRMIRTVNMKVGEEVRRVIRSCHSPGYAPYSNLEFVQAMLDNAGDYASLPVIDWRVTDTGMRLRFAAIDAPLAVLSVWDPSVMLTEPIPMIETWNSEVGRRKVGLRGGMWRLVCTNGMGHWDDRREWSWIHRGDAARIQQGVSNAFEDLFTTANGVVDAYKDALTISISDAYKWMQEELHRAKVTKKVISSAEVALTHPTTTPGGSLASVIDAITLVAQDEDDLFAQSGLERTASSILRRGLSTALRNNNTIPVN